MRGINKSPKSVRFPDERNANTVRQKALADLGTYRHLEVSFTARRRVRVQGPADVAHATARLGSKLAAGSAAPASNVRWLIN